MSENRPADELVGNAKPVGTTEFDSYTYEDLDTDELKMLVEQIRIIENSKL